MYAGEGMLMKNFKSICHEITLENPLLFESVTKTPYPIICYGL